MTMPDYDPTQPIARQATFSAGRLLHDDCPTIIRGSHSYESTMAERREPSFNSGFICRPSERQRFSDDQDHPEHREGQTDYDNAWIRSELVDGDVPCLHHMEAVPIGVILIAIEEDDHADCSHAHSYAHDYAHANYAYGCSAYGRMASGSSVPYSALRDLQSEGYRAADRS